MYISDAFLVVSKGGRQGYGKILYVVWVSFDQILVEVFTSFLCDVGNFGF